MAPYVVITVTVAAVILFITWTAMPKQRGPSETAMSGPIFQPALQRVY